MLLGGGRVLSNPTRSIKFQGMLSCTCSRRLANKSYPRAGYFVLPTRPERYLAKEH